MAPNGEFTLQIPAEDSYVNRNRIESLCVTRQYNIPEALKSKSALQKKNYTNIIPFNSTQSKELYDVIVSC
jgi:hypothetical protein